MKVRELLNKKMDQMNEADYKDLEAMVGMQFGFMLTTTYGITNLSDVSNDKLHEACMDQEVMELPCGLCVFIHDARPVAIMALREKLLGKAGT